jgi:hypothetical protein
MADRLRVSEPVKPTIGKRIATEIEAVLGRLVPGLRVKRRAKERASALAPMIAEDRNRASGVLPFPSLAARDALKTRTRKARRPMKDMEGQR